MQRKQEEVRFGGATMSLTADLSCLQGEGGADREAALAMLEKQLTCPICLELFNKPVVILPCQHNLCRKCANELYQPSLFQARTTMMVNSGRFRCPSCRHEVVLDRHGVYGLQRNLLVENIIDIYKQEVSKNNATSTPPPPPSPVQLTCSDHEGEKVNIYCLTCQLLTCSLCKVFGAHQSCQVAPLTDVYQQHKDELSEAISSLVAVNDKVQTLIDELEGACRNIEENCETKRENVCEKFNRMFSILEEKCKAMTQRISSEQEEKSGHAQALVCCYGDSVEANSKLMERAVSSMEETDMAAFVQNSRELITNVIAASSSSPVETLKPDYENMSHYRFNFSRQEQALKSIDFIKVMEDIPQEPEFEPEPEEPEKPFIHTEGTSIQDLESGTEPVPELISPTVEPIQTAAAAAPPSALIPHGAHLLRDPIKPAGAILQLETEDSDLHDVGYVLMKNKMEEEEDDSIKEGNICELQEGMSTQQCEGREAESGPGDWMAQRQKDKKQDEENLQMEEGTNTTFYPSWYNPGRQPRVYPDDALKLMMCSTQPAVHCPSEAKTPAEAQDVIQTMSALQMQPQLLWSQESKVLSETQTQVQEQGMFFINHPPHKPTFFSHLQQLPHSTQLHAMSYLAYPQPSHHSESQSHVPQCGTQTLQIPVDLGSAPNPVPQVQKTAEVGITEKNNEELVKSLSLVEGSFDCAEGSSDNLPLDDINSDKDIFQLSDGRVQDVKQKEQLNKDIFPSELRQKELAENHFEAVMMENKSICSDKRSELQGNILSVLEKGRSERRVTIREESFKVKNGTLDSRNVVSTDSLIQRDRDSVFEACGSGFAEEKQEGRKNSEPSEAFGAKMEASVAEAEEKITSCLSLQIKPETRCPYQTSPPLTFSSSSNSNFSQAPRQPSFCFSWLNSLHKK